MKTKNIATSEINLKDDRFRISYYFSLDNMALSLNKIGLIHPPLVTFRGNKLVIISGWKRVLGCLKISLSPIPVMIVDEKDDRKTFLISFYENLAIRKYGLLEKAEILNKLRKFGEDEKDIVKQYLPLLDIPQTLNHVDMYMAFSRFEPELKEIIHEKHMNFAVLCQLSRFNSQERKLLLPVLLASGQNKQKEILEYLWEISRRENTSAEKILTSDEFRKILESEKLSPLQKADSVRCLLKRKRYPVLFAWNDGFDSSLKKVQWPEDLSVSPFPSFEGEEIFIKFGFKSKKEFMKKLLKLQELSSKEEFSDLFGPFSHEQE